MRATSLALAFGIFCSLSPLGAAQGALPGDLGQKLSAPRGVAPNIELVGGFDAQHGAEQAVYGGWLRFIGATSEVKGGLVHAAHLELALWGRDARFDGGVALTLLDARQLSLGQKNGGGGLCLPGFAIAFWGDCRADSGWLFARVALLRGAKDLRSKHGGVQWAALGLGVDLAPRRFGADFMRWRLPLSLGLDIASLFSVPRDEMRWAVSRPYLRFEPMWRSADHRWEISAEAAARPRIDAFTEDLHLRGRLRVAWLTLVRAGRNNGNLLRLYLQLRYDYRSRPEAALSPTPLALVKHRLLVSLGGSLFFLHAL
jgi:hypothetical protein